MRLQKTIKPSELILKTPVEGSPPENMIEPMPGSISRAQKIDRRRPTEMKGRPNFCLRLQATKPTAANNMAIIKPCQAASKST